MDPVYPGLRESRYSSGEQLDTDLQMYESDVYLPSPHDSTSTPPGAIGSSPRDPSSFAGVPTAGGWVNTGGSALNLSQSAPPAQGYDKVTAPVSPTFLHMVGMPQLEVPTAGVWVNTGGSALNLSQSAPPAQGYGTVPAPLSPALLQILGLPQLEVLTAGGWVNIGGSALNLSQSAPPAQNYGKVTAPVSPTFLQMPGVPQLEVPTAGVWVNTGGSALNLSQSAPPAQGYGKVTAPVSPTFLQMPGLPQLEVPTGGVWVNTGGSAVNLSQSAPPAQGYGTVPAPVSPTFLQMPAVPQLETLQDNSNIASPNIDGPILDYPTPGAPQDGYFPLTLSQPELPTGSSQFNSTASPATTAPMDRTPCPACPKDFNRWQDCDRHIITHLPHWIHCPVPECSWRSSRVKSFEQHWGRRDHLQYHGSYGGIPGPEHYKIFDPQEFVNQIKAGTISASDAASHALTLVRSKADQLQKSSMLGNLWGYKLKHAPQ